MTKITIRRHRSAQHLDGGSTVAFEAEAGPRNLLAAARALPEYRQDSILAHGNRGAAGVTLHVGDALIGQSWLPSTLADARDVLARVAAGQSCADPEMPGKAE